MEFSKTLNLREILDISKVVKVLDPYFDGFIGLLV